MGAYTASARAAIPASPRFEALVCGAQFRDRIAVRVHASPETIFRAAREVTLSDMPLARAVGELRYLPSRLGGHHPPAGAEKPFITLLAENGTVLVDDNSPRELITGSAGHLHRIVDQAPVHFERVEDLLAFDDPDCEKLFMSLRVEPTGAADEYWLVLEHATRALSAAAARKFRRYWRVIRAGGAFVTLQLLKAIRTRAQRAELT